MQRINLPKKRLAKKVLKHLKEDTKDYKKGIRDDKKLSKVLRKV
jgi:hypothetical protein